VAVDRKQVALTGVATAILIAIPVVVSAVEEIMSGRWDEQFDRRKSHRPGQDRRDQMQALRHPSGRPLEQLVVDLRRLRRLVATDEHRSAAKQFGDRIAYDYVLAQLCDMLGIPHGLHEQTGGHERDLERFRVEAELERAGIVLSYDPSRKT
jgi:hypothetical protein